MNPDQYVQPQICSGLWKFSGAVAIETLVALAETWKAGPYGRQYVDPLYIRRCSKHGHGIGFTYDYADEGYNAFFSRITDQLKRQFGNDFAGWDIGPRTWIIDDPWSDLAKQARAHIARLTDEDLDRVFHQLYDRGWAGPECSHPMARRDAHDAMRRLVLDAVSKEKTGRREESLPHVTT